MSVPNTSHHEPPQLITDALRNTRDALELARQQRITIAHYARSIGLTNQQIADAYGISESAVRALLKRNEARK